MTAETDAKPRTEDAAEGDPLRLVFAVFNEIGIIEQLASTRFSRVMPMGLHLSQFTVLNHFVRLGGERTPLELARAFQVSKGTMTNTLQRLQARELIAMRPDPKDRRSKRVTITEAGRAAHAAAIEALRPEVAALSDRLDLPRLAEILPDLRRLRETLDKAREGEPPPDDPA
jgi:DNA-binding MarR family transcriptional regulator